MRHQYALAPNYSKLIIMYHFQMIKTKGNNRYFTENNGWAQENKVSSHHDVAPENVYSFCVR